MPLQPVFYFYLFYYEEIETRRSGIPLGKRALSTNQKPPYQDTVFLKGGFVLIENSNEFCLQVYLMNKANKSTASSLYTR